MSELTVCNYCSLKHIKSRAKQKGWKVTMLTGWRGGKNVYIHPKGIKITELNKENQDYYFVAWFWEISNNCVC